MKPLRVIIPILLILALGAVYYTRLNPASEYANTKDIDGDWIVTDYQVIENTMLNIEGNIIVEGDGHLVLSNCYLNFQQDHNNQYSVQVGSWEAKDTQRIELTDVVIDTAGKWMYFEFLGNTEASYTNVQCSQLNLPWHLVAKNSKLTAKDTNIGVTFADNATMTAEDSDLFIEMVLRNCSGEYALPLGEVDELSYEFDMGKSKTSFETTGCSFREWGVTLDYNTDIRFVDTKITIGLNAGTGPEGVGDPIIVSGLKAKKYDYFELVFGSNIVELMNCDVVSWYPQAFNGAVIDVSDSYLADVQWNSADSKIIVRDSTAYMAYGVDDVTYVFYDSEITGEVTATNNSKIYLINTKVHGKTTATDNGQVFIDEEPQAVEDPEYKNVRTIEGDWIITGYEEINDTWLNINGSISVQDEGKLVVRDSYLNFSLRHNNEHRIQVGEWLSESSPGLVLENVFIDTGWKWMSAGYTGNSRISYTNVSLRDPNIPWHGLSSTAEFDIKNSKIGVTVEENTTVRAVDSNMFFELMLGNITGSYTMPRGYLKEQEYVFETGNTVFSIETTGCTFRDWCVTLDYNTNVTFIDTMITIVMNAGLDRPPEEKQFLNGLKAKRYDFFEVNYDSNYITLINSEVSYWYPQAWGGTVLEVTNSDLADLQWNGGDSVIIVRNCTASVAYAMDEVSYYIYNSTIRGEVTATADSKIYLYGTKVNGEIFEIDNGQVFIDDEPYEG